MTAAGRVPTVETAVDGDGGRSLTVERESPTRFRVLGGSRVHVVVLDAPPDARCDCAAHRFRPAHRPCKHVRAVTAAGAGVLADEEPSCVGSAGPGLEDELPPLPTADVGTPDPDFETWERELDRDLEAVGAAAGEPVHAFTFKPLADVELEDLPPPRYLLQDWLVAGGLHVVWGPSGVGKSFLTIDWAMSVGAGLPWLGHTAAFGPTITLIGEGVSGFGRRVAAWRHAHGLGPDELTAAYFVVGCPQLTRPDDLTALWADIAYRIPGRPSLLIVDTLTAHAAGGEENETADRSQILENLRPFRDLTGAAVLLVHHANASGARERGNTALRAAADRMIAVRAEEGAIVVEVDKARDGVAPPPLRLRLAPCGDSAILERADGILAPAPSDLSPNEQRALEALAAVEVPGQGATSSEWAAGTATGSYSQLPNGSFYRARKRLIDLGLVEWEKGRKRYSLSGRGIARVTPTSQPSPNTSHGSSPTTPTHRGGYVIAPGGSEDLG